jgi:hypothetical protein
MLPLCSSKTLSLHGRSMWSLAVRQEVCELFQEVIVIAEQESNLCMKQGIECLLNSAQHARCLIGNWLVLVANK